MGVRRGEMVMASRFETTRSSALWFGFESHVVTRGSCQLLLEVCWLVHSREQFVPPAVETISIYNQGHMYSTCISNI